MRMRRGVTWGLLLVLIGILLLLDNLGYLTFLGVSIWQILGPLLLIALGFWVLFGHRLRGHGETETLALPLEGTSEADVQIEYGAGEFRITGAAEPGDLLSGTFEGGVAHRDRREGARADIRLWTDRRFFTPFAWGPDTRHRWNVALTDRIPLALTVKTGASDCRIDLSSLRVTRLRVETGASSTHVTLPARAGHTEARISSGVASVSLRIPPGVAARIRSDSGLASVSVDRSRFPRQGGVYVSPDYETAENRVDIRVDTGVGSLDIR